MSMAGTGRGVSKLRTRHYFGAGSGLGWDNAYPEQKGLSVFPTHQIILTLGARVMKNGEWFKPIQKEVVPI